MRTALRRPVFLLLTIGSLFAAGCSSDDVADTTATPTTARTGATTIPTETAPPTTAPTTTTTTTTTKEATTTTAEPTTTTVGQNLEVLCDGYLAFVSAGDPSTRVAPLDAIWAERGPDAPEDLSAAIETLKTANYGSEDVRPQRAVLVDFVLPLCEGTYNEGVEGAADDATAAEQFFAALVAGDKETARTLAPAQVVAPFDPWEPYTDQADVPELIIDGGQFYVTLTSSLSFRCEMSNGIVTGCFFG